MSLLRNFGRRKVRTTLTVLGITIGIWVLVVFSSMANKVNALVAGGSEFYAGKVTVSAAGGSMGFDNPMAISTLDEVAKIDWIDVVVPGISMLMSDHESTIGFGLPDTIQGQVAGADQGRETFPFSYATGRALQPADEGSNVAVLGSDLARKDRAKVGDTVYLRGEPFAVVGIMEPTLTAPDTTALVPLAAAQRPYLASLPALVSAKLDPATIITGLIVYPEPGADPEVVAGSGLGRWTQ